YGEHGLIDICTGCEASLRVLMLAYCHQLIKPGTVGKGVVANIDMARTVLAGAAAAPPSYMDGASFLPLLAGKAQPWRKALLYEYYWERNYPHTPTIHALRGDRYKYIHYHGIWDIDELYDLQEDPLEINNLIRSGEHQAIIKE